MKRLLSLLAGAATPLVATAHDGHGLADAAHWHATDVLGFVLVGGALAWAVWRGRQ
ncbi:hypothetical protein [Aquabacterium sp. J223]|uniref:hypothetical protein n=1 Tax=Aquabacterium sp. J223 TaxID=2898431 RepID=UPI0021ADAE13|nr:hypothetical protein [Aquabacterium sp. J223]UUX95626.1 hypothetical protein LRS07_20905 [Aquabacterium sp. J223]